MAPLPHFSKNKILTYIICYDCNTYIPTTNLWKTNLLKSKRDKALCYTCARKNTINKLFI